MNNNRSLSPGLPAGFTLIELLVVIAIIATLAGLLLPAIGRARVRAQVTRAQTEIKNLQTAVNSYKTEYGRYPVSKDAETEAPNMGGIYTFGLAVDGSGNATPVVNPRDPHANNVVMAILLGKDTGFDDNNLQFTIAGNAGNKRNPRNRSFFDSKINSDNSNSGIGRDLNYRDPWGNPYIFTFDLDYDEQVSDVFYTRPAVSQVSPAQPAQGFNGFVSTDNGASYHLSGGMLIWSLGPDSGSNGNRKAIDEPNKDNILSWK